MDFELIVSLLTLIAPEAVLGIDNVIFISIIAAGLPENQQKKLGNTALFLQVPCVWGCC